MTTKVEKLVTEALDLPLYARAFVAEKLIESLDMEPLPDLSQEWKNEIEKRCNKMDEDNVELLNADSVFKKAFATLQ
jgi:putative addiction module component (TIGR02574 family)